VEAFPTFHIAWYEDLQQKFALITYTMDPEADRQKAMTAVRAVFERYKILAARRPKDHVVSSIISAYMLSR
jgi:hypothetical protein